MEPLALEVPSGTINDKAVNSVFYTFTRVLSKHAIVQKLHYHVVNTYRTKRAIAQHINCLLLHYYVVDM